MTRTRQEHAGVRIEFPQLAVAGVSQVQVRHVVERMNVFHSVGHERDAGNTLRGLNDYAQNFAGNAYQQAFNNYNAQQTNIFNRLSTIAGLGQTSNQTTATTGAQIAGNVGNAQMAAGAANAAGIVGSANALTQGGSNALGWYTYNQLMNPSGGGGGGQIDV